MKTYSLTRRLIISILLVELLSALCLSAAATFYERHVRFHAFDIMLRGRADSLLGDVQDAEDPQDNVMLDGTQVSFPAQDIYQVQDTNGRVLGHSPNWAGPSAEMLASPAGKFFRFSLNHRHYRVLRIEGLRMVDPGDKGGGIPRRVSILYGSPTEHLWHEIWDAVGYYAAVSLALLALSWVLILWLLKRGLAPLHALAAEAGGVSVDAWDFVPPPQARQVRELAPLTAALETVLGGLERSFMQQRRFVGDAAHELKTAVAVLKSSLQLLVLKPRTAQEYERGIAQSQLDCDRMEEAVARMLTLARVEAKAESPALHSSTDLSAVLRQSAQQLDSMAELKQLRVVLSARDHAFVDVDAEQLLLLCGNLLMNAMQHSPAGAEIRAIVTQDEVGVAMAIEDDGDGIAPQDVPHVFERFYRGDPSRSRNTGGTGLGLAICKAIATAAHGSIAIQSELGKGTRVEVRLPALAAMVKSDLVAALLR